MKTELEFQLFLDILSFYRISRKKNI